jgi:ketosteroid isomerase-like protein
LVFISFFSQAQQQQKEINEQVWKPFIASFNSFDPDKFLALHSKQVVRSSRDSKTILNWDQYYQEQKQGDVRSKADQRKRMLELRFTERITNNDQAIDVGIYKTTSINSKGESRSFYGRFHVVLRKENGTWKILVDTDSSENNTIDEEDFNAASSLE